MPPGLGIPTGGGMEPPGVLTVFFPSRALRSILGFLSSAIIDPLVSRVSGYPPLGSSVSRCSRTVAATKGAGKIELLTTLELGALGTNIAALHGAAFAEGC